MDHLTDFEDGLDVEELVQIYEAIAEGMEIEAQLKKDSLDQDVKGDK